MTDEPKRHCFDVSPGDEANCHLPPRHDGPHESIGGTVWGETGEALARAAKLQRRARGTTTGSSTRPAITFRAPTAEHYDRLAKRATAKGTTVNGLAKERVFPTRKKAHSASR